MLKNTKMVGLENTILTTFFDKEHNRCEFITANMNQSALCHENDSRGTQINRKQT